MNETDVKMGRIMFHACKVKLTKYKCVFNHRLAIFELRSFKTNRNSNNIESIYWNSAPFIPNHETIKQWDISCIEKIAEAPPGHHQASPGITRHHQASPSITRHHQAQSHS